MWECCQFQGCQFPIGDIRPLRGFATHGEANTPSGMRLSPQAIRLAERAARTAKRPQGPAREPSDAEAAAREGGHEAAEDFRSRETSPSARFGLAPT